MTFTATITRLNGRWLAELETRDDWRGNTWTGVLRGSQAGVHKVCATACEAKAVIAAHVENTGGILDDWHESSTGRLTARVQP